MGRHAFDCSARLDSVAMIRIFLALLGVAVWLFWSTAEAAGVSYQFRGVNVVRVGGQTHIAGTIGTESASIPLAGSGSNWHLGTGALWQNGSTQILGHAAEFVSQHPIAATAGAAAVTAVRANPAGLLTQAIAGYLLEQGLQYLDGEWKKTTTGSSTPFASSGSIYCYGGWNSPVQCWAYAVGQPVSTAGNCSVWTTASVVAVNCTYIPAGNSLTFTWPLNLQCPTGQTYDNGFCVGQSQQVTAQESDWDAIRASYWPDPALRDLVRNGVSLPTDKPIYNPTSKDIDVSDPYTDPLTGNRYKDKARVTPSTSEPGKADVQIVKVQVDVNGNPVINPTTGQPVTEKTDPKDPCELNPERMGCKEFGTPQDTGDLPEKSVGVSSITPVVFASNASCPADIPLPKGATFSFEWPCRMAEGVKPFLLVLAWLIAGMIVIGVARDNG